MGIRLDDMEVFGSETTHASKVEELGADAALGVERDAEGNVIMGGQFLA